MPVAKGLTVVVEIELLPGGVVEIELLPGGAARREDAERSATKMATIILCTTMVISMREETTGLKREGFVVKNV